jgi:hypothetical protein
MGWLGLDVLVRLAESPGRDGGALLRAALANFPKLPLAIALIDLEALALRLLQTRDLDPLSLFPRRCGGRLASRRGMGARDG